MPSRQRLRQFPEKNDATATRALLHHRRVKTIICLSVFVTIICLSVFVTPLVCVRHPVCPLISVSRQSARTKDRPNTVKRKIAAHTGPSKSSARSKSVSRVVYGRSGAHTLAKGIAAECNRRRPASSRDTDHLPIPSVSLLSIRIFGPELCRGTDATREWSVSWQRKNSESRTRNAPFPSTRVAREVDYHTGRRLSGSSGSFCGLSVLNDNGGLFRQTGAQRPRAGVSVGHTDVTVPDFG